MAGTESMNRSGNEFFTGASLSQDEHGRRHPRNSFDLVEDVHQTTALADNRVELASFTGHGSPGTRISRVFQSDKRGQYKK